MSRDFMTALWEWHNANPDAKGMPISGLIECMATLPEEAVLLVADFDLVRLAPMDLEDAGQAFGPTLETHDIVLRIGHRPQGT